MTTTTLLIGVIVLLGTALGTYLAGCRTGFREGFAKGKEAGTKESTDKAFAVGYDRGKREQEAAQAKPAPVKRKISPWWIVGALTVVILVALETLLGDIYRVR